eukprot:1904304-Prymnesium_polylepis.1
MSCAVSCHCQCGGGARATPVPPRRASAPGPVGRLSRVPGPCLRLAWEDPVSVRRDPGGERGT